MSLTAVFQLSPLKPQGGVWLAKPCFEFPRQYGLGKWACRDGQQPPLPPGSVPVSKWGQKINKHCTSDYWAEDKSAWFDRSLLPASLPPSKQPSFPLLLSSSLLLLHPAKHPSCPFFSLLPSHLPSLHLFLLHPSLTLIPHTLRHSPPFWPAPAIPPCSSNSCLMPLLYFSC